MFAVAAAIWVLPTKVTSPPLCESVDVAAVEDAFFGSGADHRSRPGAGSIEFHYTDYRITIGSDGWVQVPEAVDHQPS